MVLLPNAVIMQIRDPILVTSASTLTTLLLGIIFLMTTKPWLVAALLAMGIALFLGLLISFPYRRAVRWRAGQPGDHGSSTEGDPFLKKTIWTRRW